MSRAARFLVLGGTMFLVAGSAHALGSVWDCFSPTFFTPVDAAVRESMMRDPVALSSMGRSETSMWSAWLGFNIGFGMGAAFFGLVTVLLGRAHYDFVKRLGWFQPLATMVAAVYLVLSLRFWFYMPTILIAAGLLLHAGSWALARRTTSS